MTLSPPLLSQLVSIITDETPIEQLRNRLLKEARREVSHTRKPKIALLREVFGRGRSTAEGPPPPKHGKPEVCDGLALRNLPPLLFPSRARDLLVLPVQLQLPVGQRALLQLLAQLRRVTSLRCPPPARPRGRPPSSGPLPRPVKEEEEEEVAAGGCAPLELALNSWVAGATPPPGPATGSGQDVACPGVPPPAGSCVSRAQTVQPA